MKNIKFFKKFAAVALGFVMTLGVGAAGYAASVSETRAANPASPITLDWNNGATQPEVSGSAFTTGGSTAAFATSRFALKGANAYVIHKSIFDANTEFSSFSVKIYGASNSGTNADTTGKLSVSLVDANGSTVSELSLQKAVKYGNYSGSTQIDSMLTNDISETYAFAADSLANIKTIRGIKINLDVKGSNYILRRAVLTFTIKSAGSDDDSGGESEASNYQMIFKSGTGDGSEVKTTTSLSNIFSDGSDYASSITSVTKTYYNGSGGLKLGASSSAGSITFALSNTGKVKATTIVVNAKLYSSSKSATLNVNSKGTQNVTSAGSDLTYTINGNITSITLASSKYIWVSSITVNYEVEGPVAVTGVTVDPTSIELAPGGTQQLTATVSPSDAANKSVEWSSSKETVATVSNSGLVTAVGVGNTTITVTTKDGGKTATCLVTVSNVAVTGVSLNKNSTTLYVGGTETLTATVSPSDAGNKSVGWSSSDESVATVSNGTITALKAGSTIITVTTVDGNKTATCAVTVSNVSVTGVSLDKTTASVYVGGTFKLVPTISPSNATNKNVTWTSSNTEVATVGSDGTVTPESKGTTTITVTTTDGSKTASCVVTVDEMTGIIENGQYVISHVKDGVSYYLHIDSPSSSTQPTAVTELSSATLLTFTLLPGESDPSNEKYVYEIKYDDTNYLYTTDANNGVRINTTKGSWEISEGYYGNGYNLKSNGRYLTCYNGSDFRAYTSTTTNRTEDTTLTKICNHTASDAWATSGSEHWHVCSQCGEEIADSRATHTADTTKWVSDENGHWRVCSVCGAKIDSTYAAHSGGTPTVEHGAYCEVCNHEYGPKHTHTADTSHWETDGTYHWRVCSDCGDAIEETKVAHTPDSVWHSDATGHWHICSVCGIKLDSTFASHSGGEATEEHGAYCEYCEYEYTSALPHEHSHDGSWVSDDANHWHICQKCSEVMEETVAAHTYGDWVIDSDSTFEETGSKHRDCSICGHTETATIPCKEHSYSDQWTDAGSSGHAHFCLDSGYESLNKDLTAHTYGDWITDQAATYTAAGSKHHVCTVCSHSESEVIPMLVHHYSESWTSAGAEGHWHVCTDAGYGDLHSPETPVAHNMVKIDHQDATADDEGYDLFECTDCGYQNTIIIPPSATYTMTIDSSANGNNDVHWTNASITSLVWDSVTWTTSIEGNNGFTAQTSYAQIGSKNNPATKVTLSTGAFAGKTITSLSFTGGYGTNAGPKLSVIAGDATFLNDVSLASGSTTTYSTGEDFEPIKLGDSDQLVFTITSSAKAALYIGGVSITYVGSGEKIDAESVTLNSNSESLTYKDGVGSSFDLVATVMPENCSNKHVSWTSSDESVATVSDSGKVTATGIGTATITATTHNNLTATCTISVSDPDSFDGKYTFEYNFKDNFGNYNEGWSSSYTNSAEMNLGNGGKINISGVSKQSNTIADMPVTKGDGIIMISAPAGKVVSSAEIKLKEWSSSKDPEVCFEYSTDGTNFIETDYSSYNYYLDVASIPSGAVKVRFTFGNTDQAGILGVSYEVADKTVSYIWKNYDGSQLYRVDNVTGSEVPSYVGSRPTKPATSTSEFLFNGWSNPVEDANDNFVFTAQFKEIPIEQYITIDDPVAFEEFQEAKHFDVQGLPSDGKLAADMEFNLNTTNGRVFDLESVYFFIETVGDCTVKYSCDGETWHVLDNACTPTTRGVKRDALPEDAKYLNVYVNDEAEVKGMSIKTRLPIDGASSEAYITWNWEETAPGVADVSIAKTGIKFTFTFNQLGFADYLGENNDAYSAKFVYGYSTDEMTYEELMDYDGKKISADTLTTIKHEGEASFTIGLSKATSWQRVYTCALVIFDSNGNVVDHSEVLCASFEDVFYEYYDSTDMSQKYEEQALDIILGQLI